MAQKTSSTNQFTWGDIYSLCSKLEVPQENVILSTRSLEETLKQDKSTSPLDSDNLLRNYGSGFTKSNAQKDQHQGNQNQIDGLKKLSTEEIVRRAGERYIEWTRKSIDANIMFTQQYSFSLSGHFLEEQRNVELVHVLLSAAEKVGNHQHEEASKFLERCDWLASDTGNPMQRVVYYFTKALRERICRETGGAFARKTTETQKRNMPHMSMSTNLIFMKYHQVFPFIQVMTFAGVEAILKRVRRATKIHLIDFQIRSGVQWTTFMQAISERVSNPVKRLKITAIGITDREKMVEAGKNLETFAKSLNLTFSYRIIFLSDMNDLHKEHFITKPREAVVVYCPVILRTMVFRPSCLENLMKVMKELSPCMVVVIEVEANHNSPSFFHRFVEALFSYSAYFDCLDEFSDRENNYRNILEKQFLGDGIENIVAAEGMDRVTRNVTMSVWENFFQRLGMVKMDLGESSIYQANINLNRFACASSCNINYKRKSLTIDWKGTPIHSLSIWKFY